MKTWKQEAVIRSRGRILEIAKQNGYDLEQEQANIGLMIFVNGGVQINVYVTSMTVGTCLNHPKKGKTQLFRRGVTFDELETIFKKPRWHSGFGYRKVA